MNCMDLLGSKVCNIPKNPLDSERWFWPLIRWRSVENLVSQHEVAFYQYQEHHYHHQAPLPYLQTLVFLRVREHTKQAPVLDHGSLVIILLLFQRILITSSIEA